MSQCAILKRTAVVFSLVLLSGCFDYTEEVKLDEKGGGTLSFTFSYGNLNFMERTALKLLKSNPFADISNLQKDLPAGVKPVDFKEETKDEKKIVSGGYQFDDINKLSEWAGKRNLKLFSTISLTKVSDTWVFKRSIQPDNEDEVKEAKKLFDRSRIVLKVTGPGQLTEKESNPTRVEGNTCIWEGSLPKLLEGSDGRGTDFKAQYFVGTPMWIKAAIGVVVLLIVVGITAVLMKKKQAAPPPASTQS